MPTQNELRGKFGESWSHNVVSGIFLPTGPLLTYCVFQVCVFGGSLCAFVHVRFVCFFFGFFLLVVLSYSDLFVFLYLTVFY